MATVTAQKLNPGTPGRSVHLWPAMAGADVGSVVKLPHYTNLTVQMGTQGGNTHGGSTTVMQGSLDPVAETDPDNAVWFTLTEKDTASTALSRTTSALFKEVKEHPLYIRPSQSGGTGGDIDVIAQAS